MCLSNALPLIYCLFHHSSLPFPNWACMYVLHLNTSMHVATFPQPGMHVATFPWAGMHTAIFFQSGMLVGSFCSAPFSLALPQGRLATQISWLLSSLDLQKGTREGTQGEEPSNAPTCQFPVTTWESNGGTIATLLALTERWARVTLSKRVLYL